MRRAAGQAGRVLHRACGFVFTLALLVGLGLGAAAWRLAQGPVELPFLADRIEAAFNEGGGPTRLEIGKAIIAWQGWEHGRALPLELTLRGVRAVEAGGAVRAELPDAAVSLSPRALLEGRLVPRSLVLRGPRLRAFRAEDGGFAFDLGSLAEDSDAAPAPERQAGEDFAGHLLAELQRPPSDRSALSALRRVAVHGGRLTVVDRQLDRSWAMEGVEIELVRRAQGGLDLTGSAVMTLGEERVPVRLAGSLGAGPQHAEVTLVLPSVRPAALARAAPALAPLAMLDASAAVNATARFDEAGRPVAVAGEIVTGAGSMAVGRGKVGIAGLELRGNYAEGTLRLEQARLRLAPPAAAAATPPPVLTAQGEAQLAGGVWRARLELGVDRVAFADLAQYWPEGIGGNARRWMTANLTAGVAQNGRWRVEAQATEALEGFTLLDLSGSAEASGTTVHWLRPIGPVENVSGRAEFSPTAITIRAQGGRQSGTGLELREGVLKVSFETDPEIADFNLRLAGPLGDAWTLVRHPRLHLFDRRPPPIGDISGTLQEARIALTFPMVDALPAEEVRIRAQLRAADVRIPRAVLDRDLERGAIEVTLDNDGLRATGQAVVAEIPLRLTQEMDFRPGPATQVLTRENATAARAEVRQLAALGFDVSAVAEGAMGLELRNETRRNGQGRLVVKADLRDTRLSLDPLAWSKPRGTAGSAEFALRLQNGALAAVESARIEAPDALIRGRADVMRQGMPERLEIQDSQLGRSRFSGELRPPASQGAAWNLALRGPLLDLAPAMAAQDRSAAEPPTAAAEQRGPAVALYARFDQVVLGEGRQMTAVAAEARVDGAGVVQQVTARGRLTPNAGFELSLVPQGRRRELRISSEDGGALLRAFDLVGTIQGGRLAVLAHYDSQLPGATLAGTAELSDFSVRNAPALGKLLQAMTLYGLVDALSGPGLGFTRLVAPFRLTRQALTIEEARAFSSSLGLTAKGHLDRRRSILDMEGTIVPAYFINSLLGHIPLVGRIFSPEAGGGVFAATYRVRGPLNDPTVTVNPLAALTPGFLRGLFGPLEASREPMQVPGQR